MAIRRLFGRTAAPVEPDLGERVLAWAETDRGVVAGTRDALYLPGPTAHLQPIRVPWHQVETADWDADSGALIVREVGTYGLTRPEHRLVLDEPGRLLELLRERVTSTIVLTRPVSVPGQRGAKVIGRRSTSGDREIAWFVEYDAGLDPADPAVAAAVDSALAEARAEVGLT